jgi:hypothetical protein
MKLGKQAKKDRKKWQKLVDKWNKRNQKIAEKEALDKEQVIDDEKHFFVEDDVLARYEEEE